MKMSGMLLLVLKLSILEVQNRGETKGISTVKNKN